MANADRTVSLTEYTRTLPPRARVSHGPVALIYGRGSMSFEEACKAHLYGKGVIARHGDWVVTDFGVECLASPYWIEVKRLWGPFWLRHMQEKTWVVYEDFCAALEEARQVHHQAMPLPSQPKPVVSVRKAEPATIPGSERRPRRHSIGNRLRFLVMKRDGYACKLCGRSAAHGALLHIDHKIAVANGGTNDMDNLWVLCALCNSGKRTDDL